MSSPRLLHIIADYGLGDPAFSEVVQRLSTDLSSKTQIQTLSVPSFDTLATGFWTAQFGLNPGPIGLTVYSNTAPRKDDLKARKNNEGEGLIYALLPNDVKVIGVNSGYTFSFVKKVAKALRSINVPQSGSQFRSRDIFPKAVTALANGDETLLGGEISSETIPDIPRKEVVWVDGYGNIKTTISADSLNLTPGSTVNVKIGNVTAEAIFADGSFTVPDGVLAFAPGSSGWRNQDGQLLQWMELFLRGGSAWDKFNRPKTGTKIALQPDWRRLAEIQSSLSYAV